MTATKEIYNAHYNQDTDEWELESSADGKLAAGMAKSDAQWMADTLNSHADLLAALERLCAYVEEQEEYLANENACPNTLGVDHPLHDARAAIRKAGGES